ncbi:Thiol-specific monooxygenase [Neofusicoccum parvum]|uniref:Thiol-specific monooxygenase n=1 Tax=Neofusicoccum parvum TaxID=310453 RepID=A0ACB5SQT7_9PEZI|nr:Thiol-specific monooxygenase [Neofusicoccum parvum]
MAYTQEPIPKTLSERSLALFGPDSPTRHHTVIKKHIEDIFARGGHEKLIEFNTSVELAEKKGAEWILTLRKERPGKATDYWWQETFDAVVVASGHYYVPHIPNIPGLIEYDQRFPGRIHHTKHFRSADDFKDKRVLVIGGSISAIDAVHDIRAVAAKPIHAAIRNPLPAFGMAPFEHPHIAIRKPVALLDPASGRVYFDDGSAVDGIDRVVFATGYDFSFPFLPSLKTPNRRVPGLYLHVFDIAEPTLAFVGAVSGFTFKAFEYQAVAVARLFAGRAELPEPDAMRKWEADHLALRGEGKPFYTLAPDFEQYFEALRKVAGEPAEGTTGRVLPPFDQAWLDVFARVLETRLSYWRREAKKVKEEEAGKGVRARL